MANGKGKATINYGPGLMQDENGHLQGYDEFIEDYPELEDFEQEVLEAWESGDWATYDALRDQWYRLLEWFRDSARSG